jgi:hypothetical protein
VLLGVSLSLLVAQADPPPVWTLDDALSAALRSSPELTEARARERAAHSLPRISRNLVSAVALSRATEFGG